MKFLPFILILWHCFAFAQESVEVEFLETQRSSGSPFGIPVFLTLKGDVSLLNKNGADIFNFQPAMQVGLNRTSIEYSQPIILNRFNFYPIHKNLGWKEVKRQRIEVGLGLSTLLKSVASIGLTPYRGGMQTIIRHKSSRKSKTLPFRMPKKLAELEEWNEGDSGFYQTYGGVSVYIGMNAGVFNIATLTFGIQNQFLVGIKKIGPHQIILSISEENLKRRQITSGPPIASGTLADFYGKRFSTEFNLDLHDPYHHMLFEEALNGNINILQEKLPYESQRMTWAGKARHVYFTIPLIAGRVISKAHFELTEDGVETELDLLGKRNDGIVTPIRNHQKVVYQTDEGIVLVWSSEMNRLNAKTLDKYFYSKGRIIGVKGFNQDFPPDQKYGSVVSQIGLHFTRQEAEEMRSASTTAIAQHLKEKCEREKLPCSKSKNFEKIIARFEYLISLSWKDMRGELGPLLMKEPALIYAVVKTLRYKKEVYFKFLSDSYQSLEGLSLIEI